jgi:hypothetical protein
MTTTTQQPDWLFLEDGYTATKVATVDGRKLSIRYRPALHGAKRDYQAAATTGRPGEAAKADEGLIARHLESIDGRKIEPAKIGHLRPAVISALLDLILGYTAEDEATDLKN